MGAIKIENDSGQRMLFQLELDLKPIFLVDGETMTIEFDDGEEPPTLILGRLEDEVFGAILPGDGKLNIERG